MNDPQGNPCSADLADEDFASDPQTYTLTRIYHLTTGSTRHTVRVQVRRNSYQHQSDATAELLSATMTWTQLAATAADSWWPTTPLPASHPAAQTLARIADELLTRAIRILVGASNGSPTGTDA